jgi:hypothetical protein
VKAVNAYSKLGLAESPTLWYEFHGTVSGVEEQAGQVQEIARSHGGEDFSWSSRPEERTRLWQARHDAYFACLALRKGSRMVATDVCVPISRLTECIVATQDDIAQSTMPIPLFGHVGDGNFHLMILVDPDSEADTQEAWDLGGVRPHQLVAQQRADDGREREQAVGRPAAEAERLCVVEDAFDVLRSRQRARGSEIDRAGDAEPHQRRECRGADAGALEPGLHVLLDRRRGGLDQPRRISGHGLLRRGVDQGGEPTCRRTDLARGGVIDTQRPGNLIDVEEQIVRTDQRAVDHQVQPVAVEGAAPK